MLIRKVLFATLLAHCCHASLLPQGINILGTIINVSKDVASSLLNTVKTEMTNAVKNAPDLPTDRFLSALLQNMFNMLVEIETKDNNTIQNFNHIWTTKYQDLIDKVRGVGTQLRKVGNDYQKLQDVKNSNAGILSKMLQTAQSTASLAGDGVGLASDATGALADGSQVLRSLLPLITGFFRQNFSFLMKFITFIPVEIMKKLQDTVTDVKSTVAGVLHRVQRATTLLATESESGLQQMAPPLKNFVEIPLNIALMVISRTEMGLRTILTLSKQQI